MIRMVALAKVFSLMIKEKQESRLSSWLFKWFLLTKGTAPAPALSFQVIQSEFSWQWTKLTAVLVAGPNFCLTLGLGKDHTGRMNMERSSLAKECLAETVRVR